MHPAVSPKLSICITTLNRAAFIGATLESILVQATEEFEIVLLDAGSTDSTREIATKYARQFPKLRYVRQERNGGVDADYDRAVQLAHGEYCWLMSDDDFIKPNAIKAVLSVLRQDVSLVLVNIEIRDFEMSTVLVSRYLPLTENRTYNSGDLDPIFQEAGSLLEYSGCIVIKREIWIARNREKYYGSLFIHLGVIFSERLPGTALILSDPLVSYRAGNTRSFTPKLFETFAVKWPNLVWSLPVSESAKQNACRFDSWVHLQVLLLWRAYGLYSLSEYQRYIRPQVQSIRKALIPMSVALIPSTWVNALYTCYYLAKVGVYRNIVLYRLRESRSGRRHL